MKEKRKSLASDILGNKKKESTELKFDENVKSSSSEDDNSPTIEKS